MMTPKIVTCIDTGEWSNAMGYSAPRIYTPLRELEENGRLQIDRINYMPSPVIDKPFREETEGNYKLRHSTRRSAERERVRLTAQNFRINTQNFKNFNFADKELSPIVCVNMRPGESKDESPNRNALLTALIKNENVERILLAPPYFSRLKELTQIEKIDKDRRKIILWTPYRYATGIAYARRVLQTTALGAASIVVNSGPYPSEKFVSEFALPFLDAFFSLTGPVLKQDDKLKLSIQNSAPNGLLVLSTAAKHTTGATSSILLSTAGGSFGTSDHCSITLLSVDMTHINLSNALMIYSHRRPDQHLSNGRSHDPPRSTLNGGRYLLLNACFSETTSDLPTVSSFKPTQEVIDEFLRKLQ